MSEPTTTADVRAALIVGVEIALFDVREEAPFAEAHPLFAACLPYGRIELEIFDRVPRKTTRVVVYDAGEGLAGPSAERLEKLGYTNVAVLAGGLAGWREAGGELFRDVNVPSKAFGELVEARRHTPSLTADEVRALLDENADVVVLDARRREEYQTMSIPTATSVPGAELVLRVKEIAPRPETLVIVNCAGRTRSIIGTQSLVNAGIPNRVAALRNGTIGWVLAGHALDQGQRRQAPDVNGAAVAGARAAARGVADRAGVRRAGVDDLHAWLQDETRTTYRFDVRTPHEFEAGHSLGFRSAPGGQLVQETDVFAPVRGARIVLWDDHSVRADMSASWLAQMGWDVYVVDADITELEPEERGRWQSSLPPPVPFTCVSATDVNTLVVASGAAVIDLAPSPEYVRGHIPGAWLASRTALFQNPGLLPDARRYILTSSDGVLAAFAAPEIARATGAQVEVIHGGTRAWVDAGFDLIPGSERLTAEPLDVYKRPYEGTDNAREAMQAYLDWEYGLVGQLDRDGTHGFRVI